MPNQKIDQIKEIINNSPNIDAEHKSTSNQLLDELATELNDMTITRDRLESVTDFTELSHKEVSKQKTDQGLLDIALKGLKKSVEDFEESHPKLTNTINAICTNLSNAGL